MEAATRVYANPARALPRLLRDPAAVENLRTGHADRYGKLRGRSVLVFADRDRENALRSIAEVTGRLNAYQRSLSSLEMSRNARMTHLSPLSYLRTASSPQLLQLVQARGVLGLQAPGAGRPARAAPRVAMPRPAQLQRELTRLTNLTRTFDYAAAEAQNAIEVAVRGLARATVHTALRLLPPSVSLPVDIAVRTVERVLGKGIDLGLGR
jgi:hypothetical protein